MPTGGLRNHMNISPSSTYMFAGIRMPLPTWNSGKVLHRMRDLQAEGGSHGGHEFSANLRTASSTAIAGQGKGYN